MPANPGLLRRPLGAGAGGAPLKSPAPYALDPNDVDPRTYGTLGAGAGGAAPPMLPGTLGAGAGGAAPPMPGTLGDVLGTLGAGAGGSAPPIPTGSLGAGSGGVSLGNIADPIAGDVQASGHPLAGAGGPGGVSASSPMGTLPQRPSIVGTPYVPFKGPLAPTYTPRDPGTFSGPNPADVANDPYYQFRSKEGEKAIQHAAAMRGTLNSGGLLKSLERYRQGLASEESGKAFDRALQSFNANTGATLGYNTQAGNATYGNYDRAYGAGRDAYGDERAAAHEATDVTNANAQIAAENQAAQQYAADLEQAQQAAQVSGGGGRAPLDMPGYYGTLGGGGGAPEDATALQRSQTGARAFGLPPNMTVSSRLKSRMLGSRGGR